MKKLTEKFDRNDVELSDLARAIGHPARIAILKAIADRGGQVQGEIVPVPEMAASTVIQHMRELKKAGLINGKIFGNNCSYGLNAEVISKFSELTTFLSHLPGRDHRDLMA